MGDSMGRCRPRQYLDGAHTEGSAKFAESFGATCYRDLGEMLDLYAAQATAFSAALAGAGWEGATLGGGVRVSGLLGVAWEFTRERAAAMS
jgi:hypothetical protein